MITQRVEWLVRDVIRDLVGLEVVLFFQANPGLYDTREGISQRLGYRYTDVAGPLERLAAAGILERFEGGERRGPYYGLKGRPEVWELISELSRLYLEDAQARQDIISILIRELEEAGPPRIPHTPAPD